MSVKQLGEKIRAEETQDDERNVGGVRQGGSVQVYTRPTGTINSNLVLLSSIGVEQKYTAEEKIRVATLEEDAAPNVQANWTQADASADDYVKNKPALSTGNSNNVAGAGGISGVNSFTFKIVTGVTIQSSHNVYYISLTDSTGRIVNAFQVIPVERILTLAPTTVGASATDVANSAIKIRYQTIGNDAYIGRTATNQMLAIVSSSVSLVMVLNYT